MSLLSSLAPLDQTRALESRLTQLRRRLMIVELACGLFWGFALLAGVLTITGWLDSRLHLPALIRAIILVASLVALGLLIRRFFLRPLLSRPSTLELSLRVERTYPAFDDALASAVQFLAQPPQADSGESRELKQQTVQRALRWAAFCDWSRVVPTRHLQRAVYSAIAFGLLGLLFVILSPVMAATASLRLLDPFGHHPWPPRTLLDWPAISERLARGEPLDIQAILRGVIPSRAVLTLAVDGMPDAEFVLTPRIDEQSAQIVTRLEASRLPRDFRLRLQAGDADSGWRTVRVVPPPMLVPWNGRPSPLIRIVPPRYTGLKIEDVPDGGSSFRCVAGSRVHLRAAVDRPIARAFVVFRPEVPRLDLTAPFCGLGTDTPWGVLGTHVLLGPIRATVPASIRSDGLALSVTFTPRLSGVYALRFEDETSLGGSRLLDIRITADPSPTVLLQRPSPTRDSLAVVPEAMLTLEVQAEDASFGIRSVWLNSRTVSGQTAHRLPLFDAEAINRAFLVLHQVLSRTPTLPQWHVPAPAVVIARRLPVRTLTRSDGSPLQPGDVVVLQALADDYDTVTPTKGPGRSAEIELRIVARAELESLIEQWQSAVRQEVLRLYEQQREAVQKTADAEASRQKTGRLRPQDQDRLQQSEQTQQQIRMRLGSADSGLRAEVNRLRQTLRDNPQMPKATQDRLDELAAELDRLVREDIEPVESLLTRARKEGDGQNDSPVPRAPAALTEALEHQLRAERTLRELLERLEPWSAATEVRAEARTVLRELERLTDDTALLEQALPAGTLPDRLSPDQQADLERSANRQDRLANRLEQLLGKMTRLADEKRRAVHERLEQAKTREAEAQQADQRAQAAESPTERERLQEEARSARRQAREARDHAAVLRKEAEALNAAVQEGKGITAFQPPDQPISESAIRLLDEAARSLRRNEVGNARLQQRRAVQPLERLIAALEDQPREADLERLRKKLRQAKTDLERLTEKQEELQKKLAAAQALDDPRQRRDELQRLGLEQAKLQREARELAERLSRLRAVEASQSLSRASRHMARTGQEIFEDDAQAAESPDETLDRLDEAKQVIEDQEQAIDDELQREKHARFVDLIRGKRDRQAALLREGDRLEAKRQREKQWQRETATSIVSLGQSQEALSRETEQLAEARFAQWKVLDRMLRQSAEAMQEAGRLLRDWPPDLAQRHEFDETDASIRHQFAQHQKTALTRLEQMLDALQSTPPSARGETAAAGTEKGSRAPAAEGVPPQAQWKALRAWQAEINARTEQFAKAHPDATALTEADKDELSAIRKMQDDVTELLQELTASAGEKP